ncbi:short-chain dehydrogenase [Burkholderia sp. MSMB0856]|uniref:SDR family oxidoreductase n=1 Tax=Burkholderia sp. MSMB0856 TaxID=1637869 RepID=UPI00075F07CE|nr:SDR family oxidoreductase [Burkholderia sp. MSMB0856]AOJ90766.1 short-chain dehydrogenase [Burkholderia sp. MSMB0856]KVH38238.1 short-chain dehydrogenase [Burkholderia sp. MSMB0856]
MKTVAITGASAGVGRATAHAFARRGANVALLARDPRALHDTACEVRAYGVEALPIAVDVSDAAALDAAAGRIEDELGPLDVWVNNAMVTVFAPFDEIAPEDYARVTEVTYLGCVYGTRAALVRMAARNRGTIVQVGSALAYRSIPLQAAYCGAKHAIRGFTDALRCELLHARSRVRVTMVQLPAIDTPQFDWAESVLPHAPRPVAPVYAPEVAADAIVQAARHPCRERWVGWPSLAAIVANGLAPGCFDRYLARTAVRGQQRAAPAGPRESNLWHTVPGHHATRGAFSSEAHRSGAEAGLGASRALAFGAICALLAAGFVAASKLNR